MALTTVRQLTGESRWLRIPNVTIDGVLVTDAAQFDSFTYAVKQQGTVIRSGSMAQSATTPGLWEAAFLQPDTAGLTHYTAHLVADGGATDEKWEDAVSVFAAK